MGEESPKPASTPTRAVFLSYASQDAEAAQKICEALRAAGIEVWFDQRELRSGDAWDRQIRERIHDCRLFVPVISASTEARSEGYFRREWKLAIDRTHDMSERLAFVVPVVIDQTPDARADVPEAFRSVQWTRLPAGETPPEFVRRIQQLLSGEASFSPTVTRGGCAGGLGKALAFEARVGRACRRARGSRRLFHRREALGCQVRSFRPAAALDRRAALCEHEWG